MAGAATLPRRQIAHQREERHNIDSIGTFSKFSPVYVADRKRVRACRENNFVLEGLRNDGGFWVANEVIVALGTDVSRKRAIQTLRHVIRRIEYEIGKVRR